MALESPVTDTQQAQPSTNGAPTYEIRLSPTHFSASEIESIRAQLLTKDSFEKFIRDLQHKQLSHLLNSMITAIILYKQEKHGDKLTEKEIRNSFENVLDFKVRTNCNEDMTFCVQGGCTDMNPKCAKRKIVEDILKVRALFDVRRHRSNKPHIALELFLDGMLHENNCVGLMLADKLGSPKIISTDGSKVSGVFTAAKERLQEAIYNHEFRFSKPSGPLYVYNQKFPIGEIQGSKIKAFDEYPGLSNYVKNLTFASLGFDIAFDRMILSLLYIGDNRIRDILPNAIEGITRIRIETDPEAKFRFDLEATIK